MNNFVPGHFAPVAWQATGGTAVTLQIREHSVDLTVLLHDVTHTGTSGVRARIAGPLDCQGNVAATLDLDLPPWGAVALIPGYRGICVFGVTPQKGIQLPVSIEKLRLQSATEKEVNYSFDVKMNALAGVIVYPAL